MLEKIMFLACANVMLVFQSATTDERENTLFAVQTFALLVLSISALLWCESGISPEKDKTGNATRGCFSH